MKNQKGFIVPVLVAIIAVLIISGGVYLYQNKKVEVPGININSNIPTSTKTYKSDKFSLQFQYPAELSVSENSQKIILNHSIPYKHQDPCDFKGDGTSLDNLTDFNVSLQLFNQNISDLLQSSASPGESYVYSNPFKTNSLNGYKIQLGVEGCGNYTYYFPTSINQTLVITRSLITELGDAITNKQEYLSLPGVILPSQEEMMMNQILDSLKFTPTKTAVEFVELILYIQDKTQVATNSCSITHQVVYKIPKTTAVADASLRILFNGELFSYGSYKSVTIVNGVAKVMLESNLTKAGKPIGSLSSCESSHLLSVLRDTLTQYDSIKSVELLSPQGSIQF
ncbi:MAG: hypothetical protein WC027_00345 [Candidatus Paceibacterota bacterium]